MPTDPATQLREATRELSEVRKRQQEAEAAVAAQRQQEINSKAAVTRTVREHVIRQASLGRAIKPAAMELYKETYGSDGLRQALAIAYDYLVHPFMGLLRCPDGSLSFQMETYQNPEEIRAFWQMLSGNPAEHQGQLDSLLVSALNPDSSHTPAQARLIAASNALATTDPNQPIEMPANLTSEDRVKLLKVLGVRDPVAGSFL